MYVYKLFQEKHPGNYQDWLPQGRAVNRDEGSLMGDQFLVFRNYTSRCEEYEADRNAVSEGYGEPLIKTFKELSNDELVDVNPADVIEFLEYDHPGMYHRICAIRKAIASQG